MRSQETEIGRNDIADRKRNDVARHQLRCIDIACDSVALRARHVPHLCPEIGDRTHRAVFVDEAETDTEHDDRENDHGVGTIV